MKKDEKGWKRKKKDEKRWNRMKKDEKGWKRIKKMKKDEKVLKPIHYVALYFERDNSPENFFRIA